MSGKIQEIIETKQCPGITGTRDGFGIKNAFKDNISGKTIDNWKSWERAGYRNPLEVTKNNIVKEKIKEKIEKKGGIKR